MEEQDEEITSQAVVARAEHVVRGGRGGREAAELVKGGGS